MDLATSASIVPPQALRFRERVRQRLGQTELLVFRVAAERFAVELGAVEEAVESPPVRSLPDAPDPLLGVFPMRNGLLPLFSPARLLGVKGEELSTALVMRSGQHRVGLAVDDVVEVLTIALTALRDPPPGPENDDVVVGLLWQDGSLTAVLDARALVGACASTLSVEPA